jgi:uncharacterized protein (TIGR02246 family)
MRPIKLLQAMSIAFFAMGAPSLHAQTTEGQKTMEQAKIQNTINTNNAAVAAKNMEAILETYSADAVMVGPRGERSVGTPALREAFKNFLAIDPKISVIKSDIVQAGDTALHTYEWTMTGKLPDGTPLQQGGLSIVVLRKQLDGRWLMVVDNPFGDQVMQAR